MIARQATESALILNWGGQKMLAKSARERGLISPYNILRLEKVRHSFFRRHCRGADTGIRQIESLDILLQSLGQAVEVFGRPHNLLRPLRPLTCYRAGGEDVGAGRLLRGGAFSAATRNDREVMSGRQDSNLRLLGPKKSERGRTAHDLVKTTRILVYDFSGVY